MKANGKLKKYPGLNNKSIQDADYCIKKDAKDYQTIR